MLPANQFPNLNKQCERRKNNARQKSEVYNVHIVCKFLVKETVLAGRRGGYMCLRLKETGKFTWEIALTRIETIYSRQVDVYR